MKRSFRKHRRLAPVPNCGRFVIALVKIELEYELSRLIVVPSRPFDEQTKSPRVGIGQPQSTACLVSLTPVHRGAGHPKSVAQMPRRVLPRILLDVGYLVPSSPLGIARDPLERSGPLEDLFLLGIGELDSRAPPGQCSLGYRDERQDLAVGQSEASELPAEFATFPAAENVPLCDLPAEVARNAR